MQKLMRRDATEGTQWVDEIDLPSTTAIEEIIPQICLREGGNFNHKSIYLPGPYNWIIGEDNEGVPILVPLHKDN